MSFRRQLIRKLSRGGSSFFTTRNMGDPTEANKHAECFELATEAYLRQQLIGQRDISFLTEKQLKQQQLPLTPDFLFPDGDLHINGQLVKWIVSAALLSCLPACL